MSKILFILFILAFGISASAQRGGRGESPLGMGGGGKSMSPIQKQEAKEKTRWTFNDWLDTKKVIANQNMWLAGNRSKPVEHEFYISYEQAGFEKEVVSGGTSTKTKPSINKTSLGAFTSFVGLSGDYFDTDDHSYGWNAVFNLRVFGNSVQNTNFTLIYGGRTRMDNSTTPEIFKNQFYGASFALYISKQFGIEGAYQYIIPEKSDIGNSLTGNNIEATVFIDYKIIRLQGTWFKESLEITDNAAAVTNRNSTGILAGTKFYF